MSLLSFENHPIIRILSLGNTPIEKYLQSSTQNDDLSFLFESIKIRQFSSTELKSIFDMLMCGCTISEIEGKYEFAFPFFIDSLSKVENQNIEMNAFFTIYSSLSWMVYSEGLKRSNGIDILLNKLSIIIINNNKKYEKLATDIFLYCLDFAIHHFFDFTFTDQIYEVLNVFFHTSNLNSSYPIRILCDFLSTEINKNSNNIESLCNFISQVIENKPDLFDEKIFRYLLGISAAKLSELDDKILQFFVRVSTQFSFRDENIIALFPTFIEKYLKQNNTKIGMYFLSNSSSHASLNSEFNNLELKKKDPENNSDQINNETVYDTNIVFQKKKPIIINYRSTVQSFSFNFLDENTFEGGLVLSQNSEKPLSVRNFLPTEVVSKIDLISELYTPQLSDMFAKMISDAYDDLDLFMLYSTVFMAICEDQKNVTDHFIMTIFNSILFNDALEDNCFLDSLKFTAVSILNNSKIDELFHPIVNSKLYLPIVLSDIFKYIYLFDENPYFTSQQFILLFYNVSLFYQTANVNDRENIQSIEKCRATLLLFMENFVEKWSSSHFFNTMFLSYLFEPSLQRFVFTHLRKLWCSENCDTDVVFSIFQTCQILINDNDKRVIELMHNILKVVNSVVQYFNDSLNDFSADNSIDNLANNSLNSPSNSEFYRKCSNNSLMSLHQPLISVLLKLKSDEIEFICDILEYFALTSDQVSIDIQLSKTFSDTIQKIGVTNEIRLKLIRLLAGNQAPSIVSHFLIQQPLLLPLFFTLFDGDLPKENLELLEKLLNFSFENAIKCHEGLFDQLLLDYIETYYSIHSANNSLNREVSDLVNKFNNAINPEFLKERNFVEMAMSLFMKISLVSSSTKIVHKYISLLSQRENINFYLSSLISMISQRLRMPSTFLPISNFTPSVEVGEISSTYFSEGFTATFWLYLDQPATKAHSLIFSLSDSINQGINVNVVDTSFVIKVYIKKKTITCTFDATFPQDQWFLVSCTFAKRENSYVISASVNSSVTYSEEIEYFEYVDPLTITVNGLNNKSQRSIISAARIGPFGFFKPIFLKNVIQMQQSGPRSIPSMTKLFYIIFEKTNGLFNAYKTDDSIPCSLQVKGSKYLQNFSFDDVLIQYFKVQALIPLFKFNEDIADKIVSLFTTFLTLGNYGQRTFLQNNGFSAISHLLRKYHPKYLTYSLYSKFISMHDQLSNQALKDDLCNSIITAFDIWSKSSLDTQQRIIKHWIHNYSSIFKKSFSDVLFSMNYFPKDIQSNILLMLLLKGNITLLDTNLFIGYIFKRHEVITMLQKSNNENQNNNIVNFIENKSHVFSGNNKEISLYEDFDSIRYLLTFLLNNLKNFQKSNVFVYLTNLLADNSDENIFLILEIFGELYRLDKISKKQFNFTYIVNIMIDSISSKFFSNEVNLSKLLDLVQKIPHYLPLLFYGITFSNKSHLFISHSFDHSTNEEHNVSFDITKLIPDSKYNTSKFWYFWLVFSAIRCGYISYAEFIFVFILHSTLCQKDDSIDTLNKTNILIHIFIVIDLICYSLNKNSEKAKALFLSKINEILEQTHDISQENEKLKLDMKEIYNLQLFYIFYKSSNYKNEALYDLFYHSLYSKFEYRRTQSSQHLPHIDKTNVFNRIHDYIKKFNNYKFSIKLEKNGEWCDRELLTNLLKELEKTSYLEFTKIMKLMKHLIDHSDFYLSNLICSNNRFNNNFQTNQHFVYMIEYMTPFINTIKSQYSSIASTVTNIDRAPNSQTIRDYIIDNYNSFNRNFHKQKDNCNKNWSHIWSTLNIESAPWRNTKHLSDINLQNHYKRDITTCFAFCPMKLKHDHHYKIHKPYHQYQAELREKYRLEQLQKDEQKGKSCENINDPSQQQKLTLIYDEQQLNSSFKNPPISISLENNDTSSPSSKNNQAYIPYWSLRFHGYPIDIYDHSTHFYLSETNFLNKSGNSSKKEIIGENTILDNFGLSKYLQIRAQPEILIDCELITIKKKIKSQFSLYRENFEIRYKNEIIDVNFHDIKWVVGRNILHRPTGIEFFTFSNHSYLIDIQTQSYDFIISRLTYLYPKVKFLSPASIYSFTEKWEKGSMSNFEYLMYVNIISGRSFNDASMYPVFPWIFVDFDSPELRIKDKSIYRNLSLPVGALNQERFHELNERRNEMISSDSDLVFLYGAGFSTPISLYNWLIRIEPFTSMHIEMQNGHFDHPTRLFTSIKDAFRCSTHNANDYRELIPEFFFLPSFLQNINHFDFGFNYEHHVKKENIENENIKNSIHDKLRDKENVELPKWAKSPIDFIYKHRKLLESDYVSSHLNEWIDLIFGIEQENKCINHFHPWMYSNVWTIFNRKNQKDSESKHTTTEIEGFLKQCGQIPLKIFNERHPIKQNKSKIGFLNDIPTDEISRLKPTSSNINMNVYNNFTNYPYQYNHNFNPNIFNNINNLANSNHSNSQYENNGSLQLNSLVFIQLFKKSENYLNFIGITSNGSVVRLNVSINSVHILQIEDFENIFDIFNQRFSLFNNCLIASTETGTIRVFDIKSMRIKREIKNPEYNENVNNKNRSKSKNLSENKRMFSENSFNNKEIINELQDQKKIKEIKGHIGKINCLSSDDMFLVSGGSDSSTNMYDSKLEKTIFSIPSFQGEIVSCDSNHIFSIVVSITNDSSIFIISTITGTISDVISLNSNRHPISVKVTPLWCFIVVFDFEVINGKIFYYLELFSNNGEKICEREITFNISAWEAFSDEKGFDFLSIADDRGKLYIFEAYELQIGEPIYRSQFNIACIFYWKEMQRVVGICENGSVFFIPLKIIIKQINKSETNPV
ncbi:hypothetical protein TRFO_37259 [Tritrichomonas foetus]|uniref:BEACH domain-containing protein n=1 Tax=Tritrichomonas foetus TaxID=1144522 RepID=A0A1J4JD53_9EUKA|nr:hypothetical protein TRFO_37259 [Tritrichomonas foetus]|eukprot:OHS96577.1 hypothetical protein TRFO_37259 [Tritrichomonas foetus]